MEFLNLAPSEDAAAANVDLLQECLAACRLHDVELHVWKVAWNMGNHTPEPYRRLMREAGRTQLQADGQPTDYLAPHLVENVDLEVAAWLEIAANYPVAGLHLDYIRYPDAACDFSPSAREAFEAALGRKVSAWPDDCLENGCDFEAYGAWRRANVTRLVRRLSRELQLFYPDVKLSAAVYGNWPNACVTVAQDADDWVRHGYLDFICPMNYEKDPELFARWTKEQKKAIGGRIPFYPGIGTFLLSDAAECTGQVLQSRKLGGDGFVLFQHGAALAGQVLPQLSAGVASQRVPLDKLPHHGQRRRIQIGRAHV